MGKGRPRAAANIWRKPGRIFSRSRTSKAKTLSAKRCRRRARARRVSDKAASARRSPARARWFRDVPSAAKAPRFRNERSAANGDDPAPPIENETARDAGRELPAED